MRLRCALAIHSWSYWSYDEHGDIACSGTKFPEATHRRCTHCKQSQHKASERRVDIAGGPYLHSKWVAVDIAVARANP